MYGIGKTGTRDTHNRSTLKGAHSKVFTFADGTQWTVNVAANGSSTITKTKWGTGKSTNDEWQKVTNYAASQSKNPDTLRAYERYKGMSWQERSEKYGKATLISAQTAASSLDTQNPSFLKIDEIQTLEADLQKKGQLGAHTKKLFELALKGEACDLSADAPAWLQKEYDALASATRQSTKIMKNSGLMCAFGVNVALLALLQAQGKSADFIKNAFPTGQNDFTNYLYEENLGTKKTKGDIGDFVLFPKDEDQHTQNKSSHGGILVGEDDKNWLVLGGNNRNLTFDGKKMAPETTCFTVARIPKSDYPDAAFYKPEMKT